MTQIVNENYPLDKTSIQELKNSLIQNYNQNEIKKHNFPTEIISLPSKGLLYSEDSPLRNEYLLKWHLVKNNIKVNELPTTEKRADVGLIR